MNTPSTAGFDNPLNTWIRLSSTQSGTGKAEWVLRAKREAAHAKRLGYSDVGHFRAAKIRQSLVGRGFK